MIRRGCFFMYEVRILSTIQLSFFSSNGLRSFLGVHPVTTLPLTASMIAMGAIMPQTYFLNVPFNVGFRLVVSGLFF